jgi:hypothetical protein
MSVTTAARKCCFRVHVTPEELVSEVFNIDADQELTPREARELAREIISSEPTYIDYVLTR